MSILLFAEFSHIAAAVAAVIVVAIIANHARMRGWVRQKERKSGVSMNTLLFANELEVVVLLMSSNSNDYHIPIILSSLNERCSCCFGLAVRKCSFHQRICPTFVSYFRCTKCDTKYVFMIALAFLLGEKRIEIPA